MDQIESFYRNEKTILYTELTKKIEVTEQILQSIIGITENSINKKLAPHNNLATEITSQDSSLGILKIKVTDALIALDTLISETKVMIAVYNQLTKKIDHAKLTLQSTEGTTSDFITKKLAPHTQLITEISLQNDSFADLQSNALHALITLDILIAETKEKQTLYHALTLKITEARSALQFERGDNHDSSFNALQSQTKLAAIIGTEEEALSPLTIKVSNAIATLDARINQIKNLLLTETTREQETIRVQIQDLSLSTHKLNHRDNPLHQDLRQEIGIIDTDHHNNQIHHAKLNTTLGTGLQIWHKEYLNQYEAIKTKIHRADELLIDALEIERRLKTEAYKVSQTILSQLEKEFIRIVLRHRNKSDKTIPEEKLNLTLISEERPETIEALKRIDPRLIKLKTLYSEFKSINSEYLSRNFTRKSDNNYTKIDRDYLEALKNQAIKSFRENVEQMSDGVRSVFIQWLRHHVFKPLQNLGRKNQSLFFYTAGACKTEKELVKLGNESYARLTHLVG